MIDDEQFREILERRDEALLLDYIREHTNDPATAAMIDEFDAHQDARDSEGDDQ